MVPASGETFLLQRVLLSKAEQGSSSSPSSSSDKALADPMTPLTLSHLQSPTSKHHELMNVVIIAATWKLLGYIIKPPQPCLGEEKSTL